MGSTQSAATYRHPAVIVWSLLVAATVTSWWLGLHHGISYTTVRAAGAVILIITFLKIYFVGMYFMEIRHAPRFLQGLFIGWIVVTCAAVIGLYILRDL